MAGTADTGCDKSIFRNKNLFINYSVSTVPIIVANGEIMYSVGKGLISLSENLQVEALHCPSATMDLISISDVVNNGCSVLFDKERCLVLQDGVVVSTGVRHENMWLIPTLVPTRALATWQDMHQRLNHPSLAVMQAMNKTQDWHLTGETVAVKDCTDCIREKQARGVFPLTPNSVTLAGEHVSFDICTGLGESRFGYTRFLVAVDKYSGFTTVFLLRPGEVSSSLLIGFLESLSTRFGRPVVSLRSDNEFRTRELAAYCTSKGIRHEFTCRETSQQNGQAERAIRTLCDGMRSALVQGALESDLWCEAILYACDSNNVCVNSRGFIPFEKWNKKLPKFQTLRRFGEVGFVRKLRFECDGKSFPKSRPMVFVGYARDQAGYRLLESPGSDKVVVRAHCWNESNHSSRVFIVEKS